jgi:hypothetical protein
MAGYGKFLGGGLGSVGDWSSQALGGNKEGLGSTAYGKAMDGIGVPSAFQGVGMGGRDELIGGLAGGFLNKGGLVGKFAGDSSGFLKNFLYNPQQGILGAATGGDPKKSGFGLLGDSLGGIFN